MLPVLQTGRLVGKMAIEHAPALLTYSAIGGVGATAWLSARTAIRVRDIKVDVEYEIENPTRKDFIKATWREFIPPVVMGATTIACIIFAHRLHLQRQAAIAAAYSVLSDRYHEYRQEVVNQIGEKKESRIQDTIAQNKINNTYDGLNVIRTGNGDILFMDSFTGRYFYSSYEAIERAKLRASTIIINEYCATLNDLYSELGLPTVDGGQWLGWNIADISDQTFQNGIPITTDRVIKTPTPEELPCVVLDYIVQPIPDYDRCY